MINYLTNFLIQKIVDYGLQKKYQRIFYSRLEEIEYGVSVFCYRSYLEALNENRQELASLLLEHSHQETIHGKMIGSLEKGKNRIYKNSANGFYIEIVREDGEILSSQKSNENLLAAKGKTVYWDSVSKPGQKVEAVHYNFDGLSRKYFSLRWFLMNKLASEYDWEDKLCMMHLLETYTAIFYKKIISSPLANDSLKAIALKISSDEVHHSEYLLNALNNLNPNSKKLLIWKARLILAFLGLFIDLLKVGVSKSHTCA